MPTCGLRSGYLQAGAFRRRSSHGVSTIGRSRGVGDIVDTMRPHLLQPLELPSPFRRLSGNCTNLLQRSALGVVLASACAPPAAHGPDDVSESGSAQTAADVAPPAPSEDALATRLGTASTRSAAVEELVTRFAAIARNGTQTDAARAFADQYSKAAGDAYIAGIETLSEAQRLNLVKTLVALSHSEATPALAHAISRYATTGAHVEEAILACQAAQRQRSPEFQGRLLEAYHAIDTSDPDGLRYSRHLAAAMSFQRDDAWNPSFVQVLTEPLVRPQRFDDKPAVKAFQSGLFRQTIAARLLGESGSKEAVVPVLRLLLDADKAEVHPAAELALIKLETTALPELLQLLRGEGELVELTRSARKDVRQAQVYFATKWLDLLRLPSTEGELLSAWNQTKDPVARTLLIRSLSRLPQTKTGLDELKTTYVQTDIKVTLPEGESALEVLSEAAVQFFEPSLAVWLEDRVGRVPTVWTRRGDVQVALVMAMSRLVTAEQLKATAATAQRYGGKLGTPAYEAAAQLVKQCQNDANCYVKSVTSAATPFVAQKAATMAGCLGDSATRDALIDVALSLEDQELLNQVLTVIEHLTATDAQQAATAFATKAKSELESTAPQWPRSKRAAIAAAIARLQAR